MLGNHRTGITMNFSKNKTPWVKPFSEKVAKRVARIPTTELEMWIDQAIYEVGKCMSAYSKSRDKAYLDEALKGAEALHAVIDQLHTRAS
jgi:hypothetical protein